MNWFFGFLSGNVDARDVVHGARQTTHMYHFRNMNCIMEILNGSFVPVYLMHSFVTVSVSLLQPFNDIYAVSSPIALISIFIRFA